MSQLEELMALHIRCAKLPTPEREYRFAAPRRWRFDFAWPDRMIALETEGGTWSGGRHTRGAGFEADCEKYNEATILGWRVLRVTAGQVTSGKAIAWIGRMLE